MKRSSPKNSLTVHVSGMTCASCEMLLERRLRTLPGVRHVSAHHKNGRINIAFLDKEKPDKQLIRNVIIESGYQLEESPQNSPQPAWPVIGASLIIVLAAYTLLSRVHLIAFAPSTSETLSIGGTFVIGLIAGTSSCLAVTGGLLLALAARHNEIHQAETSWQKFLPLLHFNIGRIVSYFLLGGTVGVIGQSLSLSTRTSGYFTVAVSCVMIFLALSILKIIPAGSFPIRPPKKLSHWIASLSESDHPAAPLALGACTFFLPCGFTQSLQLAALASGGFWNGALLMGFFALGTLPSLIGISTVSAVAKGKFSHVFLAFSGTVVLVLGVVNFQSGLALAGAEFPHPDIDASDMMSHEVSTQETQEIFMSVTPYGTYEPNRITIYSGTPVHWNVDGSNAAGCTSILTIPSLNIAVRLHPGNNVIAFTAPQKGPLAFMCSMGMVRGTFTVM